MPLISLELPPGQYRNGTDYQARGRWRDANLVRWHDGVLRPIGGWLAWSSSSVTGVARGAHAWRDNSSNVFLATGTADSLLVFTSPDTLGTLTPGSLSAGNADADTASGYGQGNYGNGYYGNLLAGPAAEATVWSLDNWGENLIACNAADGKIYEWTPPTASAISAVSNAPTGCLGILVTNERILMAFGASSNPRKVAWSDQEDNTTWTADATNQAGDFELQTDGQIMQGIKARGQVLVLTDNDAHTATYVGPNDVFSFERVGGFCGAISRASAVTVDRGTFWMGNEDFFSFNGQVEQVPCEVADYVFSDMNRGQRTKIWATVNADWSEIWWFYPSAVSTEIDRYVAYNYAENHWMTGELDRTAGVPIGGFPSPIWIDSGGTPYVQETGTAHGSETPYAETGPISIGEGDHTMTAVHLYPDEQSEGEVTATFKARGYPNAAETEHGPYTLTAPTSVRFTGRQVRMKVTDNTDGDWRVGVMRLEARQRGKRG